MKRVARYDSRMDGPLPGGPEAFGAALAALEREIDWPLLERLYCWDAGEAFFAPQQRAANLDAAVAIAAALGERLAELPDDGPGRSLYVGAAVAELAPMLCEVLVLGRAVRAVNLPGPEADELNRALAAAEVALRVEFEPEAGPVDHLWVVSVLTDPEAFPALHDALYERTGRGATGRGDLASERAQAAALARDWAAALVPNALLSTTDEELPLLEEALAERGLAIRVPEVARLSPIVGDRVRHCRVRPA